MKLAPPINILGISAGFHDAAATIINTHGDILFAGQSERYSKIKNDPNISIGLMKEIDLSEVTTIAYYERPLVKQLRQFYSGQGIEWNKLTVKHVLRQHLGHITQFNIKNYNHHLCHAAAGFQTSDFSRATVVVIDAIGEWDTISIWGAEYINGKAKYKKLWGQKYPHSIGLFYTAITDRIGLKPMEDEYITMGMSAYSTHGNVYAIAMKSLLVDSVDDLTFKHNLHAGVDEDFMFNTNDEDLAGAAQHVAEELIYSVMNKAKQFNWSTNLVYMGGVALNCLANRNLGEYFEKIWIMPNPGDAGSSLGAAALAYGGKVNFTDAFLGHNIPGEYPIDAIIGSLLTDRIVGVASGRAEFGPRALGNRSLLADPRGHNIKDQVNEIKCRQKFRPFAPVVLAEHCSEFFDMPSGFDSSPYMQSVARCRRPDAFPAIVHVDGTSRVQTVADNGSGIRRLLEAWYKETGCPMLLNTSLNIRGQPMVNNRADADKFEKLYGVKVHS